MPGKRGKKKSQDRDVSFHFHSGGSLEKGAYLSEGRSDNPVFSDEFEEDESGAEAPVVETTSNIVSGTREKDQEEIQELLESAIDDVTIDKRYSEHPLGGASSDALFEMEYEPKIQIVSNKDSQREAPVETNRVKELEYEEDTIVKPEQPSDSDSDDFFNNKADERDTTLRFNENDRLLDSDDEELFYSLNKPPTSNNISDENEIDYSEVKTNALEKDLPATEEENLPINQVHDNSVIPSVQVNDFEDEEDSKAFSEVDTHPLIPTEPGEVEDKEQTKDDTSHDKCHQELPMSEEYFTKVVEDQQRNVPPRQNINKNVSKRKVPPPRPPPHIRRGPGVAVRSQDEVSNVPQSSNSHTALPTSSKNVIVTKETQEAVLPLPIEKDESAKPSGELNEEQISTELCEDNSLSLRYFVIFVVIVFLYYSLNFSSYLAGFMTGFLLFFVTTAGSFILYVKHLQTRQHQEREAIKKSMETSSQEFISQLGMDFDELIFMKNNKFGVRCEYDFNTHRSSDITPAYIKLEDFVLTLSIKKPSADEPPGRFWHFWTQEKVSDRTFKDANASVKQFDIKKCSITLVPEDIAQNRKRRWGKKYPICLQFDKQVNHKRQYTMYLFSPNAKDKEFWYRQIKLSSEGHTRQSIIEKQERFYAYMFHYMPQSIAEGANRIGRKGRRKKSSLYDSSVHFSMKSVDEGNEEVEEMSTSVSITKKTKLSTAATAASSNMGGSSATKSALSIPPTVPDNMDWLNTALARLCWDVWNEDHWLEWITKKIQRRISRIKTPSFMEPLSVSDVNLGSDIPVVRRIYAPPSLDYKGVWIYLFVRYKGTFNMTLETKMRLGRNSKDESESQQPAKPYVISGRTSSGIKSSSRGNASQSNYSNNLTVQDGGVDADDTDASNTLSSLENSTEEPPPNSRHPSAPRSIPSSSSSLSSALSQNSSKLAGDSPDSEIDSGSDDDDTSASSLSSFPSIQATTSIATSTNTASAHSHKSGRWTSMFDRIKNSSIVQRAANSRLVRMAADKVSSYNLYLTVEVKSLEGYLAVNMSPPPSDMIWYGFQGKPILDLSAKPKLGHREVTIHYVTEWIENKLKELVEKQLVLPNMESIAIPVLKSAIPEDSVKLLTSPK